jgi:hypothetical protein
VEPGWLKGEVAKPHRTQAIAFGENDHPLREMADTISRYHGSHFKKEAQPVESATKNIHV